MPPPPTAPEAAPAPTGPESTEARRQRLFREADLRAGVDPDKGLTPWRRGPGLGEDGGAKDAAAAVAAPCQAGQAGALRIEAADAAPLYLSLDEAFAGPARLVLEGGRHEGEPALSLSRLMPGVVALSSCKGQRSTVDPALLAEADRLVLVLNQRKQVKLVDSKDDQGGRAPLLRDVTVLHGR